MFLFFAFLFVCPVNRNFHYFQINWVQPVSLLVEKRTTLSSWLVKLVKGACLMQNQQSCLKLGLLNIPPPSFTLPPTPPGLLTGCHNRCIFALSPFFHPPRAWVSRADRCGPHLGLGWREGVLNFFFIEAGIQMYLSSHWKSLMGNIHLELMQVLCSLS